jgi:peptidyl-tRNA hydrolase, PTH1 family
MKLIAGLGNPGREYAGTRHNVGFMVLEELAARHRLSFNQQKFEADTAAGQMGSEKVLLLKPQTFMNLSGQSVVPAARFYKVAAVDLVVVHDELDLPLGRIQVKLGGGAGGHNGVKSILGLLGEDGFVRVRVGIGKPEVAGEKRNSVVGHVLGGFGKDEQKLAEQVIARAADAVERVVEKGAAVAMNEFNRKEPLANGG